VARLVAGLIMMLGAISVLAGCAASHDDYRPTVLPVDPSIPTPTATSESSVSGSVALIAEYGDCSEGERQVAEMVGTWPVSLVATAGGNAIAAPGCTAYTQSVGDFYGRFLGGADGARFFPAPGIDDYAGAGEAAYRDYFRYLVTMGEDPRWYKANIGNINLFLLDSELGGSDLDTQRTWLQQQLMLARSDEPGFWNVVVLNRPPFASVPHAENAAMQPAAGWDFKGWGADAVVSGHERLWEQLEVDGLTYVIAGVGASDVAECPATLSPDSKGCVAGAGAVLLTGYPDRLMLEYRTPDGAQGTTAASITLTR